MLAAKAQYSLADAKRYFREHLSVGDYYSEGQHIPGYWFGKAAADLGLSSVTEVDEFVRLCENRHPQTGEQLTLRQNAARIKIDASGKEHQAANRRVFYDFTFSPPKSVSIAALAGDDTRVVQAHDRAIGEALKQLETFAATRVRKNGQCADRSTGNIVAAVFRHDTSRALDPHLHSHCILFNATYDAVEKQWKALQNHDMLVAQKFVENVYYQELTRELVKFGYRIKNKPRGDFEIKGVSPELIDKFSKRRRQIDEKTKELLARDPEKANGNVAAIRENIAHKERPPKVRDMALSRLQRMWDSQMTTAERNALHNLTVAERQMVQAPATVAEKAVAWAEEHVFERRSVVQEHELWRHALEHARGENIKLADIQAVTRQRDYIRDGGKVTSREHLEREWEIVCMAKNGRGNCRALAFDCRASNRQLDDEQRNAVNWLVSASDFVSLFRGGAGTGIMPRAGICRIGHRLPSVFLPVERIEYGIIRMPSGLGGQRFHTSRVNTSYIPPRTMERLRGSALHPHVERYVALLNQQDYKSKTAIWHVQLFARLNQWLRRTHHQLHDLNESVAERFLASRLSHRKRGDGAGPALCRLLNLLRAAAVSPPAQPIRRTPAQGLADSYRHHLLKERGLASATVHNYARHIDRFLDERFGAGRVIPSELQGREITGFVQRNARTHGRGYILQVVTALRSFLRFLHYHGHIAIDLAQTVPAVAHWKMAALPKHLPADAVQKVLDGCDRSQAVGRRNYAILLLLARLGLRAGEVITLQLEDLDWANAQLTVRSQKGGGGARLPLPAEVGKAIAHYLRHDRPKCSCRNVFVRMVAPYVRLSNSPVIAVMTRNALQKAGVESARKGAHLFRHSLATEMLRQGASLDEIGRVLRHKDPDTTALYAKVDLTALRRLAVVWPGGVR